MATEKQIEANRRNAQKSTGPRTPEGKAASKRNALEHGLAGIGETLPADREAEDGRRAAAWAGSFGPETDYERWLVERIARTSVMVDQAESEEYRLREGLIERAAVAWTEDRAADAETLARRLSKEPSYTVSHLRTGLHGAEWLDGRWDELGQALQSENGWDDRQRGLALDLLGIPAEFRDVPQVLLKADDASDPVAGLARIVDRERRKLAESIDKGLRTLDERDRLRALSDYFPPDTPSLARNRRYAGAWQRRLDAALRELRTAQANRPPAEVPPPPAIEPPPIREPEPTAAPVADLDRSSGCVDVQPEPEPQADQASEPETPPEPEAERAENVATEARPVGPRRRQPNRKQRRAMKKELMKAFK